MTLKLLFLQAEEHLSVHLFQVQLLHTFSPLLLHFIVPFPVLFYPTEEVS